MSGGGFRAAWKNTSGKDHQTRCGELLDNIFGMNLRTKSFNRLSFCLKKPVPPLYVADPSGFYRNVEQAILAAHSKSTKICLSASVLVALRSEELSQRWANCLAFLQKFQWHFLDFDFEDLAWEGHRPVVTKSNIDEPSRIAIACALELKKMNSEFPVFFVSTSRPAQQLAARSGLLVRVPSEETVQFQQSEGTVFSEAANHLSSRERKVLEKKS